MIRPMLPQHEKQVREIYAGCHPEMPPRAADWYWAYPTLIAAQGTRVIGFTSFSLSPGLTGVLTLYGNDLCVTPAWQRQGFGWVLAQARLEVGRALGAKGFVGITTAENKAMQRIFERQGFHRCQCLPGYFGTVDGEAWLGTIG